MRILAVLLLLASLSTPSSSEVPEPFWQRVGPFEAPQGNLLAAATETSDTILLSSFRQGASRRPQWWRSDFAGDGWYLLNEQEGLESAFWVDLLAVASDDPNRLAAVSSEAFFLRDSLTDRWLEFPRPPGLEVDSRGAFNGFGSLGESGVFAATPRASSEDDTLFSLFRLDPEGEAWEALRPSSGLSSLVQGEDSWLLAGFEDGLYLSEDGGRTWTPLLLGAGFSVVAHSRNRDDILALQPGGSFLVTRDGGENWTEVSNCPSRSTEAAMDRQGTTLFTQEGQLYRLAFDSHQCVELPSAIPLRQPIAAPRRPGRFFLRSEERLLRSDDHGENFTLAMEGLAGRDIFAFAQRGDSLATVPSSADRLLLSEDRGHTWRDVAPPGLDGQKPRIDDFRNQIAMDVEGNLLARFSFHEDSNPQLYFRDSATGEWRFAGGRLPVSPDLEFFVWAHSTDPRTFYLSHGTPPGGYASLYRTLDGGLTWNPLPILEVPHRVTRLHQDENDPGRMYATVPISRPASTEIYRSDDEGASWNRIFWDVFFTTSFRVSPVDPDVLWVKGFSGLRVSRDGGETWEQIEAPWEGFCANPVAFDLDGLDPSRAFFTLPSCTSDSSYRNYYIAEGFGASWRTWEPPSDYRSRIHDNQTPERVYLLSVHEGIWSNLGNRCQPSSSRLCLGDGRFGIRALWEKENGERGLGRAVELTRDTGYFWFFEPENVEIVAKVLDACRGFDYFWNFVGGLTNLGVEVEVSDHRAGVRRTYADPTDALYETIADSQGFGTCAWNHALALPTHPEVWNGDEALELQEGRFEVVADWKSSDGSRGQARGVPLSSETGFFYFFDSSNLELLVKVLDGCEINGHFWFLSGGLTNLEVEIRVRDRSTGVERTYSNPGGANFQTVADTSAFSSCNYASSRASPTGAGRVSRRPFPGRPRSNRSGEFGPNRYLDPPFMGAADPVSVCSSILGRPSRI